MKLLSSSYPEGHCDGNQLSPFSPSLTSDKHNTHPPTTTIPPTHPPTHPHFSLLSDGARDGLCKLVNTARSTWRVASRPYVTHLVHARQTNRRVQTPSALYRDLFRVWANARRAFVQRWAGRHSNHAVFANSRDRAAVHTNLRQAVRCEFATDSGGVNVHVLRDLQKCCEMVSHSPCATLSASSGSPSCRVDGHAGFWWAKP